MTLGSAGQMEVCNSGNKPSGESKLGLPLWRFDLVLRRWKLCYQSEVDREKITQYLFYFVVLEFVFGYQKFNNISKNAARTTPTKSCMQYSFGFVLLSFVLEIQWFSKNKKCRFFKFGFPRGLAGGLPKAPYRAPPEASQRPSRGLPEAFREAFREAFQGPSRGPPEAFQEAFQRPPSSSNHFFWFCFARLDFLAHRERVSCWRLTAPTQNWSKK